MLQFVCASRIQMQILQKLLLVLLVPMLDIKKTTISTTTHVISECTQKYAAQLSRDKQARYWVEIGQKIFFVLRNRSPQTKYNRAFINWIHVICSARCICMFYVYLSGINRVRSEHCLRVARSVSQRKNSSIIHIGFYWL